MASIRNFLPKWLGGTPQASTLANPDQWLLDAIGGAASVAGMRVSPLSAMGVPTVIACQNAISRSMASVPLRLYRELPDGGREKAKSKPLYWLLHDAPNDEMTSADFIRAIFANYALRNEAFALIVRNGLNEISAIYPVENREVHVSRDQDKRLAYKINGVPYEPEQILHLRGLTLNGVRGVDLITTARDSIGLTIALQDYAARFFPNSTTPSVALEFPQVLSPEQLKKFAEEFDKTNSGNANAHRRMILHGGAKLAKPDQVNNRDRQFLESRLAQDKAICQLMGTPQSKAGITENTHYATGEQEQLAFVMDTLLPGAVSLEQAMNQKLLTRRERDLGFFFKFDLSGLLRADDKSRTEALEKRLQNGVINRNDWRLLEDMNPIEGGEKYVISQNVQMLDKSGNPLVEPNKTETQSQEPQ